VILLIKANKFHSGDVMSSFSRTLQ